MSGNGKNTTRYRTASILMAAVLVLSLALYIVSEHILRHAMTKPIKREKVDFGKALDWLPAKTKKELEYRARYLDLKQKYETAQKEPEKFEAAYNFAVHTRDVGERNEALLPYIRHPEKYSTVPNLYRAFVQMLCDPNNPQAVSIQQYYDYMNSRKDPLELYNIWNDGRNRLNKVAGRNAPRVVTEFLKPLLDKPFDYFIIRDYTGCLSALRSNARRLSLDASRRIAKNIPRKNDAETAAAMMNLALAAEKLQKRITSNPYSYNRGEYQRKEKARLDYENLKPGQDPITVGYNYARLIKKPSERKALIQKIFKTGSGKMTPAGLKLYALQADQIGVEGGVVSAEEYLALLNSLKTPVEIFLFWRESLNRMNAVRARSAAKLQLLSPLMEKKTEDLPFRDYAVFYDQIARSAVYLNQQELFGKASAARDEIRKSGKPSFQQFQKKKSGNQIKK